MPLAHVKALTIWQPYAQAVALGLKKYETRSWATKYRGPLAIHSSVRPLKKEYRFLAEKYGIQNLHFGEVVAFAELTDCILMTEQFISEQSETEISFGDWRQGRFAWVLSNVTVPEEKVIISGKQGLWNLPLEVI